MRTLRTLRIILAAAVFGLGLAACGTEEHSPGAPDQGTPAAETPFSGYVDPNDTTTTDIAVTTSAEYDADQNLVTLFAMVRDQDGNPLSSLNKDNFVVTLNSTTAPVNVPADEVTFAVEASGEPVVALVLDSSGSMAGPANPSSETDLTTRLQAGQAAARAFVENLSGGRAAVVTFNDDARTVQPLTNDVALLEQAIDSLTPLGATNFGAAIGQAVSAVGTRPGKRAMILLTDGDDTVDSVVGGPDVWRANPESTRHQGLKLAKANDFRVYTVGLGTDLSDVGVADLQAIADETGGRYFAAPDAASLTAAFTVTIPDEIAGMTPVETYVLSFVNPVPPAQDKEVEYRATAFYGGARGLFFDKAPGTYRFP